MDTVQDKESIIPQLDEQKKKKKKKHGWEKKMEEKARQMSEDKKAREERKKKKAEEVEFAFVLCLPSVFKSRTVGAVLQEFTNIGLKLLDLRCVSVTPRFIEAHFAKEGRSTFDGPFMKYISDGPLLAMKWEGEYAVKRACEHVSKKKEYPFWNYWPLVYSSDTVKRALEDAETWFRADSSDLLVAALNNRNMIFNLPDGGICGGLPQEELEILVDESTIGFNLSSDLQRFVLIKPKAFEKGFVPDLLSTIEKNCVHLRGLKMVKKSEVPSSVAWSDDNSSSPGETQEEFGIALIGLFPNSVFDPEYSLITAGSELLYASAEAESSLKFVKEFFPFGIVGWLDPDPDITDLRGGYFESTLIGLQFEHQDDPDEV